MVEGVWTGAADDTNGSAPRRVRALSRRTGPAFAGIRRFSHQRMPISQCGIYSSCSAAKHRTVQIFLQSCFKKRL
jgi:hypothetical protein